MLCYKLQFGLYAGLLSATAVWQTTAVALDRGVL